MPSARSWHADFFIVSKPMPHPFDAPLDIHQLRVFAALAKSGSFTNAGRELHLTQSAVSHSIRALEEATDCRLFDRVGKTAQLTPAGEQLLHHAVAILHENASARESLSRRRSWGRSRLRVAVSPALAEWGLAGVVAAFRRQLPDCPLTLKLADESRMLELLHAEAVDCAVGVAPPEARGIDARTVHVDELNWVVPDVPAWAGIHRMDWDWLARGTVILPRVGDGTRGLIDAYLRHSARPLAAHIEVASPACALELVRTGVGVALLAPWNVARGGGPAGLRSVAPGRRKLRRTWSALRLRERPAHLAEAVFVGVLEAALGI